MSPSDYQSFIYFRAVSHKKRVYKSVTCHRFLLRPLLEPVCWVTLVTRVFSFLWRGLSPLSPIDIAKKWKNWDNLWRLELKTVEMFGVFKLNSYFCNGIKYRLMVHVNENDCNVPLCSIETSIKYETFSLISSNILHHIDFFSFCFAFFKN